MGAEKKIQLDVLEINSNYQSDFRASAVASLPKYNSSGGIQYNQSTLKNNYYSSGGSLMDSIYAKNNTLKLAYAYNYFFSEDFKINGGISFSASNLQFLNRDPGPEGQILQSINSGNMVFGISAEYRRFYAGLSTLLPVYKFRKVLLSDNTLEKQKITGRVSTINVLAGYNSKGLRRVTLDPLLGMDYFISDNPYLSGLRIYWGGNIKIKNLLGVGFTLGNLVSLTTSLNILDRVTLLMGIYGGEHDFLDTQFIGASYTLDFSDLQYVAQIRINL